MMKICYEIDDRISRQKLEMDFGYSFTNRFSFDF